MPDLSVLALPRYGRAGASSRLRFFAYATRLAAAGIAVRFAPFFTDAYLHRQYAGRRPDPFAMLGDYGRRLRGLGGTVDLLWLEKEALPFLPFGVERRLLAGRPYVLDLDDAWHARYAAHPSPIVRRALADKLEGLAAGAATVLVGNDHLADWALSAGARRVVKLPTPVDLAAYPDEPEPETGFRLGWIGSPSSAPHLAGIAGALRRVASSGPLTLVTIAATPAALPGVPEEFHPWREATEGRLLAGLHAGAMPLFDEPFARGKSAYKIIQYMAAGRPAVASPVGENAVILGDGAAGLLVDGEDAWVAALERLRADRDLRLRLGRAGRRQAAAAYDLAVLTPRLIAALRDVTLRETDQPNR